MSYIQDPVHGHIELTPLETHVIDTVEFQRLRFIRQLALLHYVFPGSVHTRFAHSLGCCHVGALVARQLFPKATEHARSYPLQVFRLACLLHDIGHGAFSHTLTHLHGPRGESFLPLMGEVATQTDNWGITHEAHLRALHATQPDKPISHEFLSMLITARIFHNELDENLLMGIPKEVWIQDISALLFPSVGVSPDFREHSSNLCQQHRDEMIRFSDLSEDDLAPVLSSLVSGTLDCDRMDYLARDSLGCGVNYGLFDKDGLISSLKLVVSDGRIQLGIAAKRTNTMDDFLWSRYQMFRQVYCHKTASAYNLLLENALGDLMGADQLTRPQSLLDYLRLTDDAVMTLVFSIAMTSSSSTHWIDAFARRRLPKFLGLAEASVDSPLWRNPASSIFGMEVRGDVPADSLLSTTLKTEVIRVKSPVSCDSDLPILFDYSRAARTWFTKPYLEKSVFFKMDLPQEERLFELQNRLNKRLMFFYQFD